MQQTHEGIRKSALFLAGLPEEAAETLLKKFDAPTAERIRAEVKLISKKPGEELKNTVTEFLEVASTQVVARKELKETPEKQTDRLDLYSAPAPKPIKQPLESSVPNETIFDEEMSPTGTFHPIPRAMEEFVDGIDELSRSAEPQLHNAESERFSFLRKCNAKTIRRLIESESPQIIAVVLTYLPEKLAAEVLQQLTTSGCREVVSRLVELEELAPEVLDEIETALRERCDILSSGPRDNIGKSAARKILRSLSPDFRHTLLENFEQEMDHAVLYALFPQDVENKEDRKNTNPALTSLNKRKQETIAPRQMFFEDIEHLPDRALQELFSGVDARTILVSLVGAPQGLIERLTKDCTREDEEKLQNELRAILPIHPNDVAAARQRILASVLQK